MSFWCCFEISNEKCLNKNGWHPGCIDGLGMCIVWWKVSKHVCCPHQDPAFTVSQILTPSSGPRRLLSFLCTTHLSLSLFLHNSYFSSKTSVQLQLADQQHHQPVPQPRRLPLVIHTQRKLPRLWSPMESVSASLNNILLVTRSTFLLQAYN